MSFFDSFTIVTLPALGRIFASPIDRPSYLSIYLVVINVLAVGIREMKFESKSYKRYIEEILTSVTNICI